MLGLLTENGPFHFDERTSNLHLNPYSWNKLANVIYLESPSCVGFSYGGNCTSGDDITMRDNYQFLLGWFERFPAFQSNPFFLSGESYAGQYIPQLANHILSQQSRGFSFEGFIVGNPSGLTTNVAFADSTYGFLRQHALISQAQFDNIGQVCNLTSALTAPSPECQKAELALWESNLKGINPYNVLAPCVGDGPGINPGNVGGRRSIYVCETCVWKSTLLK